jgi:integrase
MTEVRSRKSNHQGHTYKVGNSWRTVIRINGTTVSANASTQQESRKRAKEKLNQTQVAPVKKSSCVSTQSVGTFVAEWLRSEHKHSIAPSTMTRYQGLLTRYINPVIGEVAISQIGKEHVLKVLQHMSSKNQSPRSQQQARALLSVALNAAVSKGHLEHNPVKLTKNISLNKKPISPLSQNEVRKLLDSTIGTFQHARLHVALLLGLRQGEALGLTWSDIDIEGKKIRVHNQIQKINGKRIFTSLKTDSSNRIVMIGDSTSLALEAHRVIVQQMESKMGKSWIDMDLVFPNKFGQPVQSKWDYQCWINVLASCHIPRRSLHNARHTAGTLLYSSGADIETIRRILGHSSIALTSRTYVHTAEQPLRKAVLDLEHFLGDCTQE